ncbi:MAG: hypothetical protein KJZ75_05120 [Hyphomonadaceae bacterium]|nr:hypothetical protein [Hyphomonadaceae bacterium]GIK48634.1 MAG: hypothetical protein BroJett013_13310 [Alphaproteobacteria bacterium]
MSVHALCAAGPIARIARVGHAPFDEDDPIEITFADGRVFHVDIGVEAATGIMIREGPLLEHAYGHLRTEEPDAYAAIARGWGSGDIDLPWLIGARLERPHRLVMTQPYRVEVGYVFSVGERELALFGEADLIFAAALDDPYIESFKLETGLPV